MFQPLLKSAMVFSFGVLILLIVLFVSCSSSSDSTTETDYAGKELLKVYGINPDVGAPKDENGDDLPESYNPLSGKMTRLEPKQEIFSTGVSWNPDDNYHNEMALLFQDKTIKLTWADEDSWVKCPHASAAGDIDGDGFEEAVSVVFGIEEDDVEEGDNSADAKLVIISRNGNTFEHKEKNLSGTYHLVTRERSNRHYLMSIALGDIDGDGIKEIAIAIGNTFMILDDAKNNYKSISQAIDFRNGIYTDDKFHVTTVASGDINNDGKDEFIVADGFDDSPGCKYYVYGGENAEEMDNGTVISLGNDAAIEYGNVATGDIDGDLIKEVVFAGDRTTGSNYWVLAAKWTGSKLKFFPSYYAGERDDWSDHQFVGLTCFNPDSKTKNIQDMIVADYRILKYDPSASSYDDQISLVKSMSSEVYRNTIAAGDVLQLGRDQVVFFSESTRDMIIYGKNSAGSWDKLFSTTVDTGETDYTSSICLPDIDGDSVMVRYESRETRFSNPSIVAVLASPPYWSGLETDAFGSCGTTLGNSQATSEETSNSFGLSASYSIGTNEETPLISSLGGVEVKQTFEFSFNYTASKCKTTEITRSYTTPIGEDLVIFACTPFDVYKYTVVRSPNSEAIGTEVTVNMPRKPQTIPMEKNKFNSLPDNPVPIDETALVHTIGNPLSYPTWSEMNDRLDNGGDGLWDETGMQTGFSNGFQSNQVVQVSSESDSIGAGFSYKWEMEVTAMGATFGESFGFSYNFEYTMSTSEGTIINGVVPNLPVNADPAKQFNFGISMYKPDSKDFPVVTYWVSQY